MTLTAKIRVTGIPKDEILRRIRNFPAVFSGRKRDVDSLGVLFRSTITHHIYTKIFTAFMAKSDGKADEFGETWLPLSPRTIAARPISRIQKYLSGVGGSRERGLLTAGENRQWKGIFASTLGRLVRAGISHGEAKQRAASTAWAVMKSRGARTKLGVFGRRKVPILRVSDRLVDSLSPGEVHNKTYVPFTKDQVADVNRQTLTFGTKVPYAARQHATRPLWPNSRNMASWNQQAVSKARDAVLKVISQTSTISRS